MATTFNSFDSALGSAFWGDRYNGRNLNPRHCLDYKPLQVTFSGVTACTQCYFTDGTTVKSIRTVSIDMNGTFPAPHANSSPAVEWPEAACFKRDVSVEGTELVFDRFREEDCETHHSQINREISFEFFVLPTWKVVVEINAEGLGATPPGQDLRWGRAFYWRADSFENAIPYGRPIPNMINCASPPPGLDHLFASGGTAIVTEQT